jgi:hypothetical protein
VAISEDTANQPVPVHATVRTATTASFTPQAGTLLVALCSVDGAASLVTTTMTDSAAGTWTLLKRQNTVAAGVGGAAEVWCRYLVSAPGALTVTDTWTANGANGGNLTVRCLLGADPVQNGATGGVGGTPVAPSAAIVPTVLTSWVYGANLNYSTNASMTANAITTRIDQFQDATNGDTWCNFKATAATASLSSTTYGFTNANASYNTALAEILPLAGGGGAFQPPPVLLNQARDRASLW